MTNEALLHQDWPDVLVEVHGIGTIDLLKMNIEGAEYEVLRGMMEDSIRPRVITTAFEGPHRFSDAMAWTKKLRDYGYGLASFHVGVGTFVDRRSDEG